MMKTLCLSALLLITASCGERRSQNFKKQRGNSVLKIEALDLKKGQIKALFEYRSYNPKQLQSINCKFSFNSEAQLSSNYDVNLSLGAFAKEVVVFNVPSSSILHLAGENQIPYKLNCQANYEKSLEHITNQSLLYQIPKQLFRYR